tara:strand:- start:1097 stop:2071 length:975 start_codon:yes stop_codon:yes gene_type:complete
MKLLYLSPRLDCSFKKGHVPDVEGPPNNPVRVYWVEFEKRVSEFCERHGHEFVQLKKALWQFTPDDVKNSDCDLALIPHHDFRSFDAGPRGRYYMQMGFPWLFSIDSKGWCGDESIWPMQLVEGKRDKILLEFLKKEMVDKNISKFAQPNEKVKLPEKYILFCCQLPHDMTIRYHSNTTVDKALIQTMDFAHSIDTPVVAKGHPINPGSMIELRSVFESRKRPGDMWVDTASIHHCLAGCEAMFSVNSGGTGLDAILHEKPIFVFGRVDYQCIAHTFDINIEETWKEKSKFIDKYSDFIYSYYINRYDVNSPESFDELNNEALR